MASLMISSHANHVSKVVVEGTFPSALYPKSQPSVFLESFKMK